MILRIVRGVIPPGTDPEAVFAARDRLTRLARQVRGIDSLIFGARRVHAGDSRIEAAIATVWRDAESMALATDDNEQHRFLGARLDISFEVERSDYFEIVGRTFAALPPDGTAYVRMLRVSAPLNQEARLVETLRAQQPRLVELGLVASHLGRRVAGADVEAVTVSVWPSREAIRAATHGGPERPLFASELEPWLDRVRLETFDGIEVAPRLPLSSGPPILVMDDELRVVDVTASAAAVLGWVAEDLVGRSLPELSTTDPADVERRRATLMREGEIIGEASMYVPEAGQVFVRFVTRRDVPVTGRHVSLIHRRSDPPPTSEDLDAALTEAFPGITAVRS